MLDDLRRDFAKAVGRPRHLGPRILAPERLHQPSVIVAERRRRHEQPAQRRIDDGEPDAHAVPAAAISGWRHPQPLVGAFVRTAARTEARLVDRAGHVVTALEATLETLGAARARIRLRRDADEALERALQMERAQAGDATELAQRDALVHVRVEVAARTLHALGHRVAVSA